MSPSVERRSRGFLTVLAATVASGGFAYLIQLAAPRLLPDAERYLAFTVFWSTIFLFGSAIAGAQQEVTRASKLASEPPGRSPLRLFSSLGVGVVALGGALVCAPMASAAFSASPLWMSVWFVVGLAGYFLNAVLAGVLYGLERWGLVAALIGADAMLRGIAVTTGFVVGASPGTLAALVALPFGVAVAIVWTFARGRIVGRITVDVSLRRLAANTAGTIVAAASTAVMVTGLPLLLRTAFPNEDATTLASLTLAITLTRAPLIIPLIAFQSFLIVQFRDALDGIWRRVGLYMAAVAFVAAMLAIAAAAWGPAIVHWISGGRYEVTGVTMAVVVASAGLVALMCLAGPALLAEGRHVAYVAAWVIAASATIALLLLPLPTLGRAMLALLIPPALGLAVNLLSIGGRRRRVVEGTVAPR